VPELRAKYDARRTEQSSLPRPAQVVSLEDFTESDNNIAWTYPCRCSGIYVITEEEMEKAQHLVGCSSCSEVVWVGYELAADEAGDASVT
jgi:diphthamide biosynthesis protein 4